jgi:hypothetical protein
MCVSTKERSESANLVPPNQHLRFRVAEEASDIGWETAHASEAVVKTYEDAGLPPPKLMPAMEFAKTILIPTAM